MAREKCDNAEENKKACTCSSKGCPRFGVCCECVAYHRQHGGTPACFAGRR